MKNYNSNNCFIPHRQNCHVNSFIDLNGIPYLLGEYLDNRNYQYLDKSLIKSEINIDQSEAMRAIVDISIDDIGKKASDGSSNTIGNNTKMRNLLKMISDNANQFDHQLDTLRKGIVIRVNYQLENQRTQQVIRSMTEDLKIKDRNYFISVNTNNINDNSIIVNFSDSIVSTINEFTHGLDRMILRITNVQMFYECVKRNPVVPNVRQSMAFNNNCNPLQSTYGTESDMYFYHNQMQNQHLLGYPNNILYNGYGYEDTSCNVPPVWATFNKFYHFDNDGVDMCLHQQEIYDPRANVVLLSCGNVKVNRAFVINPGHRIIFKFCIWKNDLTVVNNTRSIAEALQAPFIDCNPDEGCCDHHCHHNHELNPDYETLIRLYRNLHETTDRQNGMINYLMDKINALSDMVATLLPGEDPEEPIEPELPEEPDEPTENPDTPSVNPDEGIPDEANPDEEVIIP